MEEALDGTILLECVGRDELLDHERRNSYPGSVSERVPHLVLLALLSEMLSTSYVTAWLRTFAIARTWQEVFLSHE